MADTAIDIQIQLIDRLTAPLREAAASMEHFSSGAHSALRRVSAQADHVADVATRMSNVVQDAFVAMKRVIVAYLAIDLSANFKKALEVIDDFRDAVIQYAAAISSHTKDFQMGQFDVAYQRSREYAEGLLSVLVKLDPYTKASVQDMLQMMTTFAQFGVTIDTTSQQQQKAVLSIANAIGALSKQTNAVSQSFQYIQEIRGILQGVNNASTVLYNFLRNVDPEIDKHIKQWREEERILNRQGIVIERLGELLKGFGLASNDILDTMSAKMSSLHTTFVVFALQGLQPIYRDILSFLDAVNGVFRDTEGHLTSFSVELSDWINKLYVTIKTVTQGIVSLIDALKPSIGGLSDFLKPLLKTMNEFIILWSGGFSSVVRAVTNLGSFLLKEPQKLNTLEFDSLKERYKTIAEDFEQEVLPDLDSFTEKQQQKVAQSLANLDQQYDRSIETIDNKAAKLEMAVYTGISAQGQEFLNKLKQDTDIIIARSSDTLESKLKVLNLEFEKKKSLLRQDLMSKNILEEEVYVKAEKMLEEQYAAEKIKVIKEYNEKRKREMEQTHNWLLKEIESYQIKELRSEDNTIEQKIAALEKEAVIVKEKKIAEAKQRGVAEEDIGKLILQINEYYLQKNNNMTEDYIEKRLKAIRDAREKIQAIEKEIDDYGTKNLEDSLDKRLSLLTNWYQEKTRVIEKAEEEAQKAGLNLLDEYSALRAKLLETYKKQEIDIVEKWNKEQLEKQIKAYDHAYEKLTDILSGWLAKGKVSFDSFVNMFRNMIAQLVAAWAVFQVRLSMPVTLGGLAGTGAVFNPGLIFGGMNATQISSNTTSSPGSWGIQINSGFQGAIPDVMGYLGAQEWLPDSVRLSLIKQSAWLSNNPILSGGIFTALGGTLIQGLFSGDWQKALVTGATSGLGYVGGSLLGSWGGPIGAMVGGFLGDMIGDLFGKDDPDESWFRIVSDTVAQNTQDFINRWSSQGFSLTSLTKNGMDAIVKQSSLGFIGISGKNPKGWNDLGFDGAEAQAAFAEHVLDLIVKLDNLIAGSLNAELVEKIKKGINVDIMSNTWETGQETQAIVLDVIVKRYKDAFGSIDESLLHLFDNLKSPDEVESAIKTGIDIINASSTIPDFWRRYHDNLSKGYTELQSAQIVTKQYESVRNFLTPIVTDALKKAINAGDFAEFSNTLRVRLRGAIRDAIVQTFVDKMIQGVISNMFNDVLNFSELISHYAEGKITLDEFNVVLQRGLSSLDSVVTQLEPVFTSLTHVTDAVNDVISANNSYATSLSNVANAAMNAVNNMRAAMSSMMSNVAAYLGEQQAAAWNQIQRQSLLSKYGLTNDLTKKQIQNVAVSLYDQQSKLSSLQQDYNAYIHGTAETQQAIADKYGVTVQHINDTLVDIGVYIESESKRISTVADDLNTYVGLLSQVTTRSDDIVSSGGSSDVSSGGSSDVSNKLEELKRTYLQLLKEELNLKEKELQEAKNLRDTLEVINADISKFRRDLAIDFISPSEASVNLLSFEFENVYKKAVSGDIEAKKAITGVASKYLDTVRNQSNFEQYQRAYVYVQKYLANLEDINVEQIDKQDVLIETIEAQINVLKQEIETLEGHKTTLEEARLAYQAANTLYAQTAMMVANAQQWQSAQIMQSLDFISIFQNYNKPAVLSKEQILQKNDEILSKYGFNTQSLMEATNTTNYGDTLDYLEKQYANYPDILNDIKKSRELYEIWRSAGYAEGGISVGPQSGYLQKLHGAEAIIPLGKGNLTLETEGLNNEIASLRREIARMREDQVLLLAEQAKNNKKMAKLMEDWDVSGLPKARAA